MTIRPFVQDVKKIVKKYKCPVYFSNKQTIIEIKEYQYDDVVTLLRKNNIAVWRDNPVHLPNTFSCYRTVNLIV